MAERQVVFSLSRFLSSIMQYFRGKLLKTIRVASRGGDAVLAQQGTACTAQPLWPARALCWLGTLLVLCSRSSGLVLPFPSADAFLFLESSPSLLQRSALRDEGLAASFFLLHGSDAVLEEELLPLFCCF